MLISCSIAGCGKPVRSNGFCNSHYLRQRRHGDPLAGGRQRVIHDGLQRQYPSEYKAWDAMIYRCYDEGSDEYPSYGARGISVCEKWRESFAAFLDDIGPRPSSRHSLDRRDNDGNYEPDNCRWATALEQANNRRNTPLIAFRGELIPMALAARRVGLRPGTLYMRIFKYGWPPEKALTKPSKRDGRARL